MRWKRHGVTVGALGLLTAFAAPGPSSDYRHPPEIASPIGQEKPPCNIMCWTCENGKHFDRGQNVPTYQWRAVPVHTTPECEAEKTCKGAGHTEECKQPGQEGPDDPERFAFSYTEANYDAVRTMIATGALDGIVAALDADWIDYAVERRAIQIQSCTGTIIANFPVSHEWAAVLEAAADLNTAIAP